VDLRILTEPKHPAILSLRTPVVVRGQFKGPTVTLEKKKFVSRGASAIALGILLTPLAALLPTIELGLGKDNNCGALVSEMQAGASGQSLAITAANK
jgi:uncharacterized protein involved in outer membrane biogenesis